MQKKLVPLSLLYSTFQELRDIFRVEHMIGMKQLIRNFLKKQLPFDSHLFRLFSCFKLILINLTASVNHQINSVGKKVLKTAKKTFEEFRRIL